MMTMQARESRSANPVQTLRTYSTNSPRAKARLVVLAMLADGRLDDAELRSLSQHGTMAEIGISHEEFMEVLYEFCADVEQLPNGDGNYLLPAAAIEQLFREIDNQSERQTLLRQIFNMIRSDGHLSDSEADLFWHAIDTWKFRAVDTVGALRAHRQRPSAASTPLSTNTRAAA